MRVLDVSCVSMLALAAISLGCGDDGSDAVDAAPTDGTHDGGLPTLAELTPEWNELRPGGDTICGDGTPWAFYARRGTVNRVLIEYQGGGGCWNEQTCFTDQRAVIALRLEPDLIDEAANAGMHDHGDARNPFRDWHHVIISYCTADQHWGDAVRQYGTHTFHHKGAVNAQAALDWVFANIPAPERAFVTGHSAGAYGAVLGAAIVAHQYPNTAVFQLGDSGVGANGPTSIQPVIAQWNVLAHYPAYLGGDPLQMQDLNDLYLQVARAFPQLRLSEVTSAFDIDQGDNYAYLGGSGGTRGWSADARAALAELDAAIPAFSAYRSPGWHHGITNHLEFHTLATGELTVADWVASLMGDQVPASVDCGADCGGTLYGDHGAPEEWACLATPPPPPVPEVATAHVVFRLTRPGGAPAPGVAVQACQATDHDCAAPVSTGVTDPLGAVELALPTGTRGFDGFLMTRGDGSFVDRFFFRPPVRRSHHPFLLRPTWEHTTAAQVAAMGVAFGVAADPAKGAMTIGTSDCANGVTAQATVRVDGRAPDGYWDPTRGLNPTSGVLYYWVNLEPGVHAAVATRTSDGAPIASASLYVGAGSMTQVFALGPGY